MANNINFGKIYETTWWGVGVTTNTISWGKIYDDIAGYPAFIQIYRDRIEADGGVVESLQCVLDNLQVQSNPIITLLGITPVLVDINDTYIDSGATAFDSNFYGDLTSSIITTNNVDESIANTYEVKYNLTDPSGRIAQEVTRTVYVTSDLANRYRDRVLADSGTIESLQCIDNSDFSQYNWSYYFRVLDDNGIVENLECINII